MDALREQDEKRFKAVCSSLREDGAFIEVGENDNLVIQRLGANPDLFGDLWLLVSRAEHRSRSRDAN